MPENEDTPRSEIEEMMERLREAEETIAAIRGGEVDALVVGDQVYTLKGADRAYQVLVEAMSEGAATLAADGTILYCNRRLAEMLGLPIEKVIGSPLERHAVWEETAALSALLSRGPSGSRGEIRFRRGDGVLPALVSVSPLPLGENSCFCMVVTDLTEQRRAEELANARRQAEELALWEQERADWLAAILDQLPAGVLIAAADGRIVLVNEAVERLIGLSRDEVKDLTNYGKTWKVLCPKGRALAPEELGIFKALQGEATIGWEETLVRADGRLVPVICTALPLVVGGQRTGAVVVFWDITAQKEVQRKIEEASRLKDEFLSMASHELKTPVTSIKIFSELALRRPEVLSRDIVTRLLRQTDQLVQLVNDLLEVSRLEMGRMPVELRELDLTKVVRAVCERPILDHRLVFCPPEEPLVVKGDPVRLEQVFSNLLDNAIKYSPEGGRIWMQARHHDGRALVDVRDEGIGIAPEHLPHIFERFYKPGPQQAVYAGLGVGLYIAKSIVDRHGGRIWAESEPSQGTTFFVELPLAEEGA
ncbi:MAG: PAS domain-containing sensor histidine kinase [Pseudomonadota bacterium]